MTEGLPWLINKILAKEPKSIFDVDAGDGRLGELLKQHFPAAKMSATGRTSALVADAQLWRSYSAVMIGAPEDIRWPEADVIIVRDPALWTQAREYAQKAAYLVCSLDALLRVDESSDYWLGSNTACWESLSTGQ